MLVVIFAAIIIAPTYANTSGVFSPDVNEQDRSWEFRLSFEPGEAGRPDVLTNRVHYQQALNDQTRWRLIAQQSDRNGSVEFHYARLEIQHQLHEDQVSGFDSAVRFELQIAEGDDHPSRIRLAWTGKLDLTPQW